MRRWDVGGVGQKEPGLSHTKSTDKEMNMEIPRDLVRTLMGFTLRFVILQTEKDPDNKFIYRAKEVMGETQKLLQSTEENK